jgi:hypothetical protein
MTKMNRIISQAIDALVEARQLALTRNLVGKLAKIGFGARMHDDAGAESADDATAHEAKVWQIERIRNCTLVGLRRLLRWHRLAGQGRLVDE